MKLVRQTTLYRTAGSAKKVYQVDLCEVGSDRFLVNFRHGTQGAALAEGTKTTNPANRGHANRLFDDLVAAKLAEGYAEQEPEASVVADNEPEIPLPAETSPSETPGELSREQAILERLSRGLDAPRGWSLSRAVWRAGELRMRSAEPLLTALFGLGDKMLDYAICWSLAQCGSEQCRPALRQTIARHIGNPMVIRMAHQALRQLSSDEELTQYRQFHAESLPAGLGPLALAGPADQLREAVAEHLKSSASGDFVALFQLYDIDNEHARGALLPLLDTIPFAPNYFRQVRHIFKTAELRRDGEVFGRLAKRFDTTPSNWSSNAGYYRWSNRQKPTLGENPERVYGRETRKYLRQRSWRTLRRLGELEQPDYCRMATEMLLTYSDADAAPPQHSTRYDWSTYDYRQSRGPTIVSMYRDAFAKYWAFNQILYHHSPRYQPDAGGNTFACIGGYEPGGPAPDVREEAFPKLWEQQPNLLLRLLLESQCGPVHNFAARAIAVCTDYCNRISLDVLLRLLDSVYEPTTAIAFRLAVGRYDPANPDRRLVAAMAQCRLDAAREQARKWIQEQPAVFLKETDFAAALLCSPHADMRAFARDTLRTVRLDDAEAAALVDRLFAELYAFGPDDGARATDVSTVLLQVFGDRLKDVSGEVIRALLAHPLAEVQVLGGELVLAHQTFAHQPPEDVLGALINASHASVRAIGLRLVSQLPDAELKQRIDLLAALTRSAAEDVRVQATPILARLAQGDADFARRMATHLVALLLVPGAAEGVPSHTARVLREVLQPGLDGLDRETIWKLLWSRSSPAQEIGGIALAMNVSADDLTVKEIVRLADHDVLVVREAAWRMCEASVEKFRQGMVEGVRLLDVRPEDSRRFGFDYFQQHFLSDDISIDVLVGICDSVRPDVQQFGRDQIVRRFNAENGPTYLTRLSEHPAVAMQMFTSSFLEEYAAGDLARLQQLEPYLRSVLARVNQGRVARQRVLRFLESEALRDEATARFVGELLAWQSATCAVGAKAAAIETMTRIRAQHPEIDLPISVRPVEVRSGV